MQRKYRFYYRRYSLYLHCNTSDNGRRYRPLQGGQYTQVAAFGGQRLAGIFTMVNVFTGLGIAMYVISFTDYLLALVPGAPSKLIAVVVLTVMFAMNILGTKQAAILQTVMCVIMAVAIGSFVAFGIPNLQPGYCAPSDFMTKGFTGVLMASAYLSFAAGGAQYVINFSGEARNPKRDVPFAIIVPTIGISLIYAVMGTIAAGVLPWQTWRTRAWHWWPRPLCRNHCIYFS